MKLLRRPIDVKRVWLDQPSSDTRRIIIGVRKQATTAENDRQNDKRKSQSG